MRCWGELKSLRAQSVCEVSAFFSCAQFLAYVETKVSRRPTTSRNAGYARVRKSSLCYICKVIPKKRVTLPAEEHFMYILVPRATWLKNKRRPLWTRSQWLNKRLRMLLLGKQPRQIELRKLGSVLSARSPVAKSLYYLTVSSTGRSKVFRTQCPSRRTNSCFSCQRFVPHVL